MVTERLRDIKEEAAATANIQNFLRRETVQIQILSALDVLP